MKHIVMIVANPFVRDPRVHNEAKTLVDAGYRVTVVAWDRRGDHEAEEVIDGIHVHRVTLGGLWRWMLLDILRLRPWWRKAAAEVRRIAAASPVSAIHAHDLDTLPAGVASAQSLEVPLVYDSHEVWPAMIRRDLGWPGEVWARRLEHRLLPRVDACIAASVPIQEHLVRQGAPSRGSSGPEIVLNAKHTEEKGEDAGSTGPLDALFIGGLHPARFLHGLIDAADSLEEVQVRIIGPGRRTYRRRLQNAAAKTPNVTVEPPVPMPQVVPMTRQADLVVCPFEPDDPLTRIGLPNKFFEALAAGRPILTSKGTYLARLVEKEGVGRAVDHSIEGYRDGLTWYRDHPTEARRQGQKGAELAASEYGWPHQAAVLTRFYERVLDSAASKASA